MAWRTLYQWLFRGGILAVLAVAGYAGWWARDWVSPENVRAAVIGQLQKEFPGSEVRVGSARLRLLGGISIADVAVTRSGESTPFFEAPTGVIFHDKEQLNRGRLVVRKVEFDDPVIRLDCRPDGSWTLSDLLTTEGKHDAAVPTLLAHNTTLHISDQSPSGLPPITVRGVKLQLLNDPLPVLKLDATGIAVVRGDTPFETTVTVAAKINRVTKHAAVKVDVPEITVGPALAAAVGKVKPEWAELIGRASALVGLKVDLVYSPGTPTPTKTDVRVEIRNGRFEDALFPWLVDQIAGVVHIQDGRVRVDEKEKITASLGPARVELTLETQSEPARPGREAATNPPVDDATADDPIRLIEDKLKSLTLAVRNLPLSDDVFARLPDRAHKLRTLFSPEGSVDLTYRFTRPPGGWRRDVEIRPNGLSISYVKFQYPVTDLSGSLRKTVAEDGTDEMAVQMCGKAGGRVIDLRGKTAGSGDDPFIDLRVTGDDVPINDVLFAALPREKYRAALTKLGASGRGNITATIRQELNYNCCVSTFAITVTDGSMKYTLFPYPLDKVQGEVYITVTSSAENRPIKPGDPIRPIPDTDRYEIRKLTARHGSGTIWVDGVNTATANGRDRKLQLGIKGKDCPLDDSFQAALEAIKLSGVRRTFSPTGVTTFGIEAEVLDHAAAAPGDTGPAFDPETDLKLTLNFRGPTVTPDFFPYPLTDLSGVVRFQGSALDLINFSARHDRSRWTLDAGEVRFGRGGAIWANLGGLAATPVVPDAAFMTALPAGLKKGLTELNLRGPMDLAVRHLVVSMPGLPTTTPEPIPLNAGAAGGRPVVIKPTDAVVYWDAKLLFGGVSFDTGQPWADVRGTLGCVGRYDGSFLGPVAGTVWFDRATVADQPLTRVKSSFSADPQKSDPKVPGGYEPIVVRFTDAAGTLFQGFIGGEGRVVLCDPPQYRLWLTASDVRLDEIARHYKLGQDAELKGTAQARLVLENAPDPKTGVLALKGDGSVDVPTGRMYNLPVLLDLLKLAKFQAMDQTAFEEAHAAFRIAGDRVLVDHVDLIGSAVSLGGSGELDLSGRHVAFEFYTVWSQTLKRWLTTPFGDITGAVSDKLFRIEMTRGPDGTLKYDPRLVPVVTDPVRAIAERIRRRGVADPTPAARAVSK